MNYLNVTLLILARTVIFMFYTRIEPCRYSCSLKLILNQVCAIKVVRVQSEWQPQSCAVLSTSVLQLVHVFVHVCKYTLSQCVTPPYILFHGVTHVVIVACNYPL